MPGTGTGSEVSPQQRRVEPADRAEPVEPRCRRRSTAIPVGRRTRRLQETLGPDQFFGNPPPADQNQVPVTSRPPLPRHRSRRGGRRIHSPSRSLVPPRPRHGARRRSFRWHRARRLTRPGNPDGHPQRDRHRSAQHDPVRPGDGTRTRPDILRSGRQSCVCRRRTWPLPDSLPGDPGLGHSRWRPSSGAAVQRPDDDHLSRA